MLLFWRVQPRATVRLSSTRGASRNFKPRKVRAGSRDARRYEKHQLKQGERASSPKFQPLSDLTGTFVHPAYGSDRSDTVSDMRFSAEPGGSSSLRPEMVQALAEADITNPTPIQAASLPVLLARRNAVVASQTGTGKTLSYLLPMVRCLKEDEDSGIETRERRPRALVIVPNRELAMQVMGVAKYLCHYSKFRVTSVSGVKRSAKKTEEMLRNTDLLVATPGRLEQQLEQGTLFLTDVRYLVLDEADTLFDGTFDVQDLVARLQARLEPDQSPRPLQTVIVGAAITPSVKKYVNDHLPDAELCMADGLHSLSRKLKHTFVPVGNNKHPDLLNIVKSLHSDGSFSKHTIVFCNTVNSVRSTDYLLVKAGYKCLSFHSGILPETRLKKYKEFANGEATVLVTTDIASRGLDTTLVDNVINFDFPTAVVDYMHRAGRTGRAGTRGRVYSLLTKKDRASAALIKESVIKGTPLWTADSEDLVEGKWVPGPDRIFYGR